MTLTNTQRITALEGWMAEHKAAHLANPLHTHAPEYTFYCDFSSGLDPAVWGSTFHVPASLVKVYDQVAVVGGNLELTVRKLADGWHGGLVDTAASFTQLYGRFGVRAKVTQAKGLFAAPLWLYGNAKSADGTVLWENEIDVVEILANAPGTNLIGYAGYPYADVTLAHFHHGRNGSKVPLVGHRYHLPSGTFADAFHDFEVEWRADKLVWYVDGVEQARVTDPLLIPDHAMPLIIDHTVGGTWASAPDATTEAAPRKLWVDKVWATAG